MTTYINGDLNWATERGETKAEIQVELADTDPGLLPALTLGVFDYEEGVELGSVELDKAKATELRDALSALIEQL